jgi:hypothetical protein
LGYQILRTLQIHLATFVLDADTLQLLLALINIAPWIIAILYDLVLYIGRRLWHEVPVIGGRARGDRRPRADSLRERVRRLSLAEMIGTSSPARAREDARAELRKRKKEHARTMSAESIDETVEDDHT